jgi:hypothetical protein
MNDDDILERLAEMARESEEEERARLDSRWDELSAGTLPEGERRALEAAAEASPQDRAALEAFSPLGREFHRRVAARLRAEGLVGARARPASAAPWKPPWKLWGPWLRWPALAAAAAAVLLVVLWPGGGPGPLPEYTATLTGGVQSMRSAPEPGEPERELPAATVFAPGNTLELVLRPRRAVEGPVAVAAYRHMPGEPGAWVGWQPPLETSEAGTVRIRGRVGEELGLPSGDSTLLVAVGRPPLPPPAELEGRLAAAARASISRASTDTWAAWKLSVTVRAEPPSR